MKNTKTQEKNTIKFLENKNNRFCGDRFVTYVVDDMPKSHSDCGNGIKKKYVACIPRDAMP